jgi:RNA polymerase sigma-70 factor (ECF subfamily)
MTNTRSSLIRRIRDPQDNASWGEFVAFYEPLLRSYVRSRSVPQVDVADLVQDIFIKVLRALPNFNLDHQRGRFRTWLYRVTTNIVMDYARRNAARDRAVQNWLARAGKTHVEDEQPDEGWGQAHQRRALELAQDQVKATTNPRTWYCFEQRVLLGRRPADIAKELDITPNAVNVNSARVFLVVKAGSVSILKELDDE